MDTSIINLQHSNYYSIILLLNDTIKCKTHVILTDLSLHMALAFSIVKVAVLFKSVSRSVTNSPDPVQDKITEYRLILVSVQTTKVVGESERVGLVNGNEEGSECAFLRRPTIEPKWS
jgi:hypothetical protein